MDPDIVEILRAEVIVEEQGPSISIGATMRVFGVSDEQGGTVILGMSLDKFGGLPFARAQACTDGRPNPSDQRFGMGIVPVDQDFENSDAVPGGEALSLRRGCLLSLRLRSDRGFLAQLIGVGSESGLLDGEDHGRFVLTPGIPAEARPHGS